MHSYGRQWLFQAKNWQEQTNLIIVHVPGSACNLLSSLSIHDMACRNTATLSVWFAPVLSSLFAPADFGQCAPHMYNLIWPETASPVHHCVMEAHVLLIWPETPNPEHHCIV